MMRAVSVAPLLWHRSAVCVALLACALAVTSCRPRPALEWTATTVATFPHDERAFTQGLLWHDGMLYESTGLYGASSLRRVQLDDGTVQSIRYLPDDVFGEGLARTGTELIQLTWRRGIAYRWPIDGFETGAPPTATHTYAGEGWGLCFDGRHLVMSDGSSRLALRDPATFELVETIDVTLDGDPVDDLNELECVGDRIWANVWYDDRIVGIDRATGAVDAWVDLSWLLPEEVRSSLGRDAVLNGLAWRPETETMFVTGKLWPLVFEVRLVEP